MYLKFLIEYLKAPHRISNHLIEYLKYLIEVIPHHYLIEYLIGTSYSTSFIEYLMYLRVPQSISEYLIRLPQSTS